jgi:hypothetical protein
MTIVFSHFMQHANNLFTVAILYLWLSEVFGVTTCKLVVLFSIFLPSTLTPIIASCVD